MNKLVGVGLLVVVLAVSSVVVGFAAAKDVTANFVIPDYIAIYAANASVSLPAIDGPGTYPNTNTLYVVSTKAWGVTHDFAWTTHPDDFATDGGGANLFSISGSGDGLWGIDDFIVTYSLAYRRRRSHRCTEQHAVLPRRKLRYHRYPYCYN
jgi:hypothetical protein